MTLLKAFLGVFVLAGVIAAEPPARVDLYGDPLPVEAVARLGSLRLCQGATIHSMAFTPDGASLVAHGWYYNGLCVWDAANGRALHRLNLRPWEPQCAALTPDGRRADDSMRSFGSSELTRVGFSTPERQKKTTSKEFSRAR